MKAIVYRQTGGPDVLELTDRPIPEPGPGELRVRVAVSGVNPTDWKSRAGSGPGAALAFPEVVPNQDGAGTVDAVGEGVDPARVGERVWLWEAAWQRPGGTAQEYLVIPAHHAVAMPAGASFDLGASLGIPAMTAHRTLTVAEDAPPQLSPGALAGLTVLVAGGAGAVGNAAIQLAKWAGARVITTVSSAEKATLAAAAGADHVVNYREQDAATEIKSLAPEGVHTVVEVAPVANAALDHAVLARGGTVAAYAGVPGDELVLPVRDVMAANLRYQFVLVYTLSDQAKQCAVAAVSEAVAAEAFRVGEAAGLPLTRFSLEKTGDAHAAVQAGAIGKVLVDVR